MSLTTARFRGNVEREFVTPLRANLEGVPSTLQDGQTLATRLNGHLSATVEMIGPFRVYKMNVQRFRLRLLEQCRRAGWRALFLVDGRGLATVDTLDGARGSARHLVRGDEGAEALTRALLFASERVAVGAGRVPRHEVRILEVPSLFVSTLWIPWVPAGLVPLRLGAAQRPELKRMGLKEFAAIVGDLRRRHDCRPRTAPTGPYRLGERHALDRR
jgi:hypothetical protein